MNRQIGVADSKYVVSDDPLPPGHVTPRMRIANLPLKWPIHIACSHNLATDQDRTIKLGSQYVQMDFYTNLTFKVQKGRGLGSRDRISKFWDPLITFERIEISASNLAQT